MLFLFIYLLQVKTADSGSVWNLSKRCMSALSSALFSASLCRVVTEKNLEKELSKKKIAKALIESNLTEEIKKACIEYVNPALMQFKGRF